MRGRVQMLQTLDVYMAPNPTIRKRTSSHAIVKEQPECCSAINLEVNDRDKVNYVIRYDHLVKPANVGQQRFTFDPPTLRPACRLSPTSLSFSTRATQLGSRSPTLPTLSLLSARTVSRPPTTPVSPRQGHHTSWISLLGVTTPQRNLRKAMK